MVLDDCDALDAAQQHAAFALFVEAAVAACRSSPRAACRRSTCRCATTCAPASAGASCSRCSRWPRPRRAPPCAARPSGAACFLSDEVLDYLLTPLRARPQAPDGAARPARRLRAGRQARRHRAAGRRCSRRRRHAVSAADARLVASACSTSTTRCCRSTPTMPGASSSSAWAGSTPTSFRRRNDAFFADYQRGTLDIHAYIDFATAPLRARDAARARRSAERLHGRGDRAAHRAGGARAGARHQERGDLVALVTATNDFVTAPIAAAFGIAHLIAVRLERGAAGATITGRIDGTPSYREGKVGAGRGVAGRARPALERLRANQRLQRLAQRPAAARDVRPIRWRPIRRRRSRRWRASAAGAS